MVNGNKLYAYRQYGGVWKEASLGSAYNGYAMSKDGNTVIRTDRFFRRYVHKWNEDAGSWEEDVLESWQYEIEFTGTHRSAVGIRYEEEVYNVLLSPEETRRTLTATDRKTFPSKGDQRVGRAPARGGPADGVGREAERLRRPVLASGPVSARPSRGIHG